MHGFVLFTAYLFINEISGLVELARVVNKYTSKSEIKLIDNLPGTEAITAVNQIQINPTQNPELQKDSSKHSTLIPNDLNKTQDYFIDVINELLNEKGDNLKNAEFKSSFTAVNAFKEDEPVEAIEGIASADAFKEAERLKNEYPLLLYNLQRYDEHNDSTIEDTPYHNMDDGSLESNESFWVPTDNTRRIYKGERTKIKYYPFMVTVHMFNTFMCAGSIIKSDLVITAASCLQLTWNNRFFRENPAYLSVRVGSNFYNTGGEMIQVLEVYFHPDYEPQTLHNNLAIMRLQRKLYFKRRRKDHVKKIRFDQEESPLPVNINGIEILGWGAKTASNKIMDPFTNILSYAMLDIYPNFLCQEVYSKHYVTKKNFCAGFLSKGGGACNRDVGGPGIVNGIMVGVISFGSPVCGATDTPTVFTKVGFYADWIEEIINLPDHYYRDRTTMPPITFPLTEAVIHTTTRGKFVPVFPTKKKYTYPPETDTEVLRQNKKDKKVLEAIQTLVKQNYIVVKKTTRANAIQDVPVTANIPVVNEKTTKPVKYEKNEFKKVATESKSEESNIDNDIDSVLEEMQGEYNIEVYTTSEEDLIKSENAKETLRFNNAKMFKNLEENLEYPLNKNALNKSKTFPKFTAVPLLNYDLKDTNMENHVLSKNLIEKIRNRTKKELELQLKIKEARPLQKYKNENDTKNSGDPKTEEKNVDDYGFPEKSDNSTHVEKPDVQVIITDAVEKRLDTDESVSSDQGLSILMDDEQKSISPKANDK